MNIAGIRGATGKKPQKTTPKPASKPKEKKS